MTNVGVAGLGSIGGLILARVLGPTHRGELVTLLTWPATIASFASVGIAQATCYYVARRRDEASLITWSATGASLVTGVVLAAAAPWLATLLGRHNGVSVQMAWIFALSPIYLAGGVWSSALQAESIRLWNYTTFFQPLLYFCGTVTLWLSGTLTLNAAVELFGAALIAQSIFLFIASAKKVGTPRVPKISAIGPLYGYGWKVFLSTVPRLVSGNLDQLLLSVWASVSAAQLANYAIAVSISSLVIPVTQAFGSVAFPKIARMDDYAAVRRLQNASLLGTALSAAVLILVICALAPFLIPLLLGSGYKESVIALWILAPGTIFLSLNQTMTSFFFGRGKPLVVSIAEVGGALCTVALLLLLVPGFGIDGAAVTTSICYGLVTLYLYLKCRKLAR